MSEAALVAVPDPEAAFAAINWSEAGLTAYEATMQAVTIELPQPLDRGAVVTMEVTAVATFVGCGTDNKQKTTLKVVDLKVL